MRNKIIDLIIVGILAFIFLSAFIFSNGLTALTAQLKTSNIKWILVGIICIFLFWFFETLILYIITKSLCKTKLLFLKSIKIAMVGQFFSAITPFQSGGQPAQLYLMTENKIPAGISGSVLMVKFIIHQATLTIYSIMVIVAKYSYFSKQIPHFIYFCFIGFAINTFLIVIALIFSYNEKLTLKLTNFIIKIIEKLKFIKNPEFKKEIIQNELRSFHDNSHLISKNIKTSVLASILTFIQWTVYYSIPYCIYRSFGLSSSDLWTMICAQVFLTMFMSFMPLPGAAGGAEGGFYLIYGLFFSSEAIIPAIFMWRMISYYLSIAFGGIFTVIMPNYKTTKHYSS